MATYLADRNRREVDGWLWRARHAIRKGRPTLAYEAMLSALWLLCDADLHSRKVD
jgi:hypothetical protein